ncbi:MAG: metallophosphoesterase family protein [Candidatus Cryptobacteroides sp.]
MDRRDFLNLSFCGLAGVALSGNLTIAQARKRSAGKQYNMVILGDTHFDTEPESVYHSFYDEPVEWLNRVQRAEFARNGEMWRDRCPRLLKRAACLVDENTRMALQMGDLIQGDCGNPDVHKKMLEDVMDRFKEEFGGLPFVTVVGNHDVRGKGAKAAYHEYMPKRMSEELSKEILKTTFGFNVGDDAYLVLDFNHPDDAETEKLLADSKGARHTFIITHGPLFPMDSDSCRWFYHGADKPNDIQARRHFRAEFAKRKAICLCGHSHHTRLTEWKGDGGIITQIEMTSVWAGEANGTYKVLCDDPQKYGLNRMSRKTMPDGRPIKDESALFEEYRPGLTRYSDSIAAGSYKMRVSDKSVEVDFYPGDATFSATTFKLR